MILLTQQYSLAHAQGALNLSQGCPDFDALDALQDAVQRHMHTGPTQYTHHAGVPIFSSAAGGSVCAALILCLTYTHVDSDRRNCMRDQTSLPDLRLAIVQGPLQWHDVAANLSYFAELLEQTQPVDLVLLPEMFNTGFTMESAAQAEPANGSTTQWLLQHAQRLNAVVCGSLIVQVGADDYRNRLIWARPDGSLAFYDKRHLFRMAGEHHHFTAGTEQLQVELKGWRIRPLICYDLRFPVWSRDAQHTDLLFYLASWPAARRTAWTRLLPARAIENLCYVAGVNRTGTDQQGYAYSGDSQVLDFMGDTLLDAADQDGVFYTLLQADALSRFKQRFPAYLDADTFSF